MELRQLRGKEEQESGKYIGEDSTQAGYPRKEEEWPLSEMKDAARGGYYALPKESSQGSRCRKGTPSRSLTPRWALCGPLPVLSSNTI